MSFMEQFGSLLLAATAATFTLIGIEALTGDWYAAWYCAVAVFAILRLLQFMLDALARRIERALHMEYRWGKVGSSHGSTVMQSGRAVEVNER